jgi:hypothetical protein
MVQDLDMTRQALHAESQEVEQLGSCLSAVETALAAANRETTVAEPVVG